MEKYHELSETEYEIMEYFWSLEEPVQFNAVLKYFNTVKGKDWKKQTLSTFLKILADKKFLDADDTSARKKYKAKCSRNEYLHYQAVEICEAAFDNSIGKFIKAFSGGKRLDDRSIQELKDYLKQNE